MPATARRPRQSSRGSSRQSSGPAREIVVVRPVLHAGQQQVIREAKRFNVLECGRRFGKTTLGLDVLLDTALAGKPAAWFAPTYKLLAEPWREIVRATRDLVTGVNQQARRVELITGGSIDCWSLDTADAGRGYKYARVVIDEAGIVRDLEPAWTEAIRPTLTDYRGDAWFLGTPKGRNAFHQLFVRGQDHAQDVWRSWRFASTDNPHLPAGEVEDARSDMPDAAFRQEYLGEPADDGGNPFGLDAIRACIADTIQEPRPGVRYLMGVDLGKAIDHTVCIVLDPMGRTVAFDRWQAPWDVTMRRIQALASKYNHAEVMADATGLGDPVVEELQRMPYV